MRHVPIPTELADKIRVHWRTHGLFSSCITSFRRALERTTIRLPKGQASHALRHTFASHFMMNGGNILTLQKILGHSTLTMTMRIYLPTICKMRSGLGRSISQVLAQYLYPKVMRKVAYQTASRSQTCDGCRD